MAFNNSSTFKGVTSIQKDNLSNNLLLGIQDFLSWGFLNVGGFQNITKDPAVSGSYSNSHSRARLRNSDDPGYDTGQVWEGFRNDWVWESGFKHNDTKPIQVSGIWVDGFFYGSGDNTYSHFVDYPNGRVIFDYGIPTTKKVEANFSHRTVGITLSSEKFVQELMYDSYDTEDLNSYLMSGSGTRNALGQRKIQMPFVALELSRATKSEPFQLGGGRIAYNDVLFHVFSDNEFEKNNIRDALLNQSEKVIYLINRGLMKENKKYPFQLDKNGTPVKNAKNYYDLIIPSGDGGFRGQQARLESMTCTDMEPVNSWLHRCTIRGSISVFTDTYGNLGNI
tara:strand:+ start:2201 stop:3211 length:1011 start_codon:yes stop_codon:yes gene_type:complete